MPVYEYSVLVGDPQSGEVSGPKGKPPHYLISVQAGGTTYQVAVNIESTDGSQVLYAIDQNFTPPDANALTSLGQGMHRLTMKGNSALDYVRSMVNGQRMVTQAEMQLLPLPGNDGSGDLQNAVVALLDQTIQDQDGVIYAFGSQYTDGTGIHDIHMNQGNPAGSFSQDNGVWQDGGILLQMPAANTWAAIFIAFQTESWTTDDNGNAI
jgi:uncharacterized protein YukJ